MAEGPQNSVCKMNKIHAVQYFLWQTTGSGSA